MSLDNVYKLNVSKLDAKNATRDFVGYPFITSICNLFVFHSLKKKKKNNKKTEKTLLLLQSMSLYIKIANGCCSSSCPSKG